MAGDGRAEGEGGWQVRAGEGRGVAGEGRGAAGESGGGGGGGR